ncbi:MAG: prolyl oligopeptidase family serine peptidase [Ilumatobacteraceae bacterium]
MSDIAASGAGQAAPADTFPRQFARTQRLTLGEPRTITVAPDGRRVAFLRSAAGDDPVNALWVLDPTTGDERLVADPRALLAGGDDTDLPAAERARRERMREGAGGITAYATDDEVRVVAFALAGRLFVGGLLSASARELMVPGPAFDPRPDPTASRVAYVSGAALRVAELDGTTSTLAAPGPGDGDTVTWGSADFIAAEEMGRHRGYWWSPDGRSIAACRVDVGAVPTWHISDPAHPDRKPAAVRYPAAGAANPDVRLVVLGLDGRHTPVEWDRSAFPYLADVRWVGAHSLLVTVQSRDQRTLVVLEADSTSGLAFERSTHHDDAWVELVPGSPRTQPDGALVVAADRNGTRRVLVDGTPVTPASMQVRSIVSCDDAGIVVQANPVDDATVLHAWHIDRAGSLHAIADSPGVHTVAAAGATAVVRTATLGSERSMFTVRGPFGECPITSHAATPLVAPRPSLRRYGARQLATAVLLPTGYDPTSPDSPPLPVLLDPYGGPHALRVVQSSAAFATSQWLADQGFAVVVADGRGTPGRGHAWERAVRGDLASPALDDQVDALHAAAEEFPLDLSRVAIRGWSFGGYLAALAVLRRPDVVHAAIAGAPVTEWRLYDTHYTERYLGDPAECPDDYDASSLLPLAGQLRRPLLLVHGLADDNVVAAHTLQLSSALLAAGRPHEVLPLVGVTHMTPQEVVAENLLLHQLDFLRRSLGIDAA